VVVCCNIDNSWVWDVYPITPIGKFFGAITAVVGIGLIAMPTGILAASFRCDSKH
jgi:hypothetical protein